MAIQRYNKFNLNEFKLLNLNYEERTLHICARKN